MGDIEVEVGEVVEERMCEVIWERAEDRVNGLGLRRRDGWVGG